MCEGKKKCAPCSLKENKKIIKTSIKEEIDQSIPDEIEFNNQNEYNLPLPLKRTFGGTSLKKESEVPNKISWEEKFNKFINFPWQEDTEINFVSLIEENKELILKNIIAGKNYLSKLYSHNETALVIRTSDKFLSSFDSLLESKKRTFKSTLKETIKRTISIYKITSQLEVESYENWDKIVKLKKGQDVKVVEVNNDSLFFLNINNELFTTYDLLDCAVYVKGKRLKNLDESKNKSFKPIIKEGSIADSRKKEYSHIKDLDEVRPRFSPGVDVSGLSSKSFAVKECGLYIQDDASSVMIDKYGFEKGYKAWENSLDYGGAMYQIGSKIANEKWVMCEKLGLTKKLINDYFFRSYFDIWKQWNNKEQVIFRSKHNDLKKTLTMALNPPNKKSAPEMNSKSTPIIPPATKSTAQFSKLKKAINPSEKDSMRIQDLIDKPNAMVLANKMANATQDLSKLIGRGKEALALGNKEIAKLFFNKAKTILGEVSKKLSIHGKKFLKEGNKELAIKCFLKAKSLLTAKKKLKENISYTSIADDVYNQLGAKYSNNWDKKALEILADYDLTTNETNSIIDLLNGENYFDTGEVVMESKRNLKPSAIQFTKRKSSTNNNHNKLH